MDDQQPRLTETVIRIETIRPADGDVPEGGSESAKAQKHFEELVELYLKELLKDLDLNTTIKLDIAWLTQESSMSKFSAIRVNDKACRVPFTISKGDTRISASSMAAWVVETITKNAELLMPLSLSNALREQWSSKSKTCLSLLQPDTFNMLLGSTLRRGYSLERVRSVANNFDATESNKYTASDVLEQVFNSATSPIGIEVSAAIEVKSLAPNSKKSFALDNIRNTVFFELGIPVPIVDCRVGKGLDVNQFRVRINDVLSVPFDIYNDLLEPRDPWDQIMHSTIAHAKRCARSLLTMTLFDQLFELIRIQSPELVELTLRSIKKELLVEILRDLLDEEVSIRDLRRIFESLVALNGTSKVDQGKYIVFQPNTASLVPAENGKQLENLDLNDYSNWVRLSLNRTISNQYIRGDNTLIVYLLDPTMEARVRLARKDPLTPDETNHLHEAIQTEVGNVWLGFHNSVILTTIEVRKRLREMIKFEFPHLPVLCYQELSADLNIQPIARITWS